MTQRERRLAWIAGGLFGAMLLYASAKSLVINRVAELNQQIAAMHVKKQQLEQQVRLADRLQKRWAQLARKTLDSNEDRARNKLDSMIKRLLEESGLSDYSARPGSPRRDKKRAGLIFVPYTVSTAEGDISAVMRFLHAFYQQPYAMQILSFNLQPVSSRRASVLKLTNLKIEAMLMPTDGPIGNPAGQSDLEAPKPWRPQDEQLDAYAVLWTKKFMEPYEAPKPAVVTRRPPPPRNHETPPVRTDTTRQDTKLIGLVQYGAVAEAILKNSRTKQRQVIAEEEPFDDGILLLVLPNGAVVETPNGRRYVYRLGKTLQEREVLSASKHPEIYEAVKVLVDN